MYFKSVMQDPPGGEWFFEHAGERISDRTWPGFLSKMISLMDRHGIQGLPRDVAAAYMCPHLPDWFCTSGGVKTVSTDKAREIAAPYFIKHLTTYPEIMRRLDICRKCPRHNRNVCLTCTGVLDWIIRSFGEKRRKRIPEDRLSGICTCAGTFESVVASVDRSELPEWKDVPENCWRNEP
jgi:hypothetical protein